MSSSPFPAYVQPCGWDKALEPPLISQPLQADHRCDAIVIGAGYTGLAIAKRLAQMRPQSIICVLEAERVGGGSPGRNSGFVLETTLSALKPAHAATIFKLYRQAHQDMMEHAQLPPADQTSQIFKAAATPRGEAALLKLADFLQASGQPCQPLDGRQLQRITGSTYYRSAITLPGNRLVNPVHLIDAIARRLPRSISVHENTPALSLERHRGGWRVQTPVGQVQAPQVFLANNAFAKGLGVGRSRSVTIYTYAGITPVLNAQERAHTSAQGQWGLLPAHRLGTTFRTTDDGRLLVRGMYSYEKEGGAEIQDILQRSLSKRFPDMQGTQQLEQWWGGSTSLTANGAPLWGELKPGLFASIGCNGVGIVKGWLLGGALADLALQQNAIDVETLFGRPSWMPPEPFRQLGFLAVSTLEKQLAGGER
ncbi:MAG: FAD-binding oxidoreductase [Magnetovibrio sp.]|nr:FAD-binding oxidoreductase [Magnetovibrio sp.]